MERSSIGQSVETLARNTRGDTLVSAAAIDAPRSAARDSPTRRRPATVSSPLLHAGTPENTSACTRKR